MFIYSNKLSFRSLLLLSVFILLPLFDALNGYLVVKGLIAEAGIASPSQIGRLLVSILLVYILYASKQGIIPVFLFVYLFIVEVISALYHGSQYGFTYGVVSAYKLGYLILLTIIIKRYSQTPQGMRQLGFYCKINLVIISSLLYFSTVTGIGNSTYGFGFGTKSFFASGNGLGLYLGIGTLFLIALNQYKISPINQKTLLFIIFSIALIGSKTALVLCMVNLLCMVYLSRFRVVFLIFFILILLLFLPQIMNTLSLVFDVILKRLNNADNFLVYLGSGRVDYVSDAFKVYFKSDPNPFRLIFGMGAYTSFQNPLTVYKFDTLETDLFDLLFMYGLLSVLCFLSIISLVLFHLRKYKILFLGMILLSLHSIIAGHVLFNGMSSVSFTLFICIANYLVVQRRGNAKTFA